MKKLLLCLLLTVCSLNSFAGSDYDIIPITDTYVNHANSYLVEKAVHIFGEYYTVEISDIRLSPSWFHCNIRIRKVWSDTSYQVEQSCQQEDPTPDPSNNRGSQLTTSLDQGYDLLIDSWMHLYATDNYGNVQITYTIHDVDRNNTFDLILVFPYNEGTITGIEDVKSDKPLDFYYNLQGLRSKTPFQGINIVNGKKILVK